MQEKIMVSDTLSALNSGVKGLSDMIVQTENQELRQTLIQMRNQGETCQYELFTIAKNKNYYQPASAATSEQIDKVKTIVKSVEAAN